MEELSRVTGVSVLHLQTVGHLLAAVLAGGLIGLERSYHGRPAGFRTHTLVCVASALLMLVTLYQSHWFDAAGADIVRIDPTRMAQGIMTGIGFLGAGVIFKEGLSVRGLTTAASLWVTAAIGVLVGIGLYVAAFTATAITLGVLSLFRTIERRIPNYVFAQHTIRFRRDDILPEDELRAILTGCGFTIANLSYRLDADGAVFEYRMMLRTNKEQNMRALAHKLGAMEQVLEFRLSPTGD